MRGPEAREQGKIVCLFEAIGAVVITTSEGRAVHRASGLPDLWVTHAGIGLCFWWEVKGPKGRLSTTQQAFIVLTEAAARVQQESTVPRCYVGTYADAERLVVRLGLAEANADGLPVFLLPKRNTAQDEWHATQRLARLGSAMKRARKKRG